MIVLVMYLRSNGGFMLYSWHHTVRPVTEHPGIGHPAGEHGRGISIPQAPLLT